MTKIMFAIDVPWIWNPNVADHNSGIRVEWAEGGGGRRYPPERERVESESHTSNSRHS